MSRFGPLFAPAAVLAVALAMTGCSVVVPEPVAPSPSPTYAPTGDGVLRIGTLLPSSAAAQVAGVEVAVREINEAGGYNGAPVEVFHRTSGDPASDTAEASFAALVTLGVDVVIGPSSPELAERLLEPAVAAGIPLISPSALGLDSLEDSGLVFGTAIGRAAQAAALTASISEAGASSVAYLGTDDEVGADLLAGLTASLEGDGGELTLEATVDAATTDFSSVVSKTKKAKPDAVVVSTATSEQAVGLLSALSEAGFEGSSIWLASRSVTDYSASLPAGALEGATGIVVGVQPDEAFALRIRQADPVVAYYSYAAEAYDATIMAALAASISGDDGGPAISRHLRSISTGGIQCASFGECASVLATEPDIDYQGRSGPVDLAGSGDPARGSFRIIAFAADNTYTVDRVVTAG